MALRQFGAVTTSQHAYTPQSLVILSSSLPSVRTNLSSASTELPFVSFSLCNHLKISRCKSTPGRVDSQIIVPNVETQSELELQLHQESTAGVSQQIVLPNVDIPCDEDEGGERLDTDLEELESLSEDEEEEEDSWLSDFQRHLPLEVDRMRETWTPVSDYSGLPRCTSRRRFLGAPMFMSLLLALGVSSPVKAARALSPAKIDLTKLPNSSQFDANDLRLSDAASIFRQALDAGTVEEEERLWTEVIDVYGKDEAEWVPDILARAYGNRGNARSRQGSFGPALADYDRAIELAPYAVDPVLNRGVVLESLGRLEEASADYEAVLQVQPEDPAAWNNLGNVKAALNQWDEALHNYLRATQLAPKFSFAAANYALALYQVGRDNEAIRQFRNLLRRYPEFADVRAALAVSLYEQGLYGEAETNWGRLQDGRYGNREWVRFTRRWPPRLVSALEDFLDVKPGQG